jgi:hypothetical protein
MLLDAAAASLHTRLPQIEKVDRLAKATGARCMYRFVIVSVA